MRRDRRKPDSRFTLIERARKWTRILKVLAWATVVWAFLPAPPGLAVGVASLPLLAVALMCYFPGIFRIETAKGSREPAVFDAFALPSLALALKAIPVNVLDWPAPWIPLVVTALLYGLIVIFAEDVRKRISLILLVPIFCAIYAYCATVVLNKVTDRSAPTVYNVQVLGKRNTTGKNRSNYLNVSAWGPRTGPKEISVSRSVYDKRNVGDTAQVVLKEGLFGISWYYVR